MVVGEEMIVVDGWFAAKVVNKMIKSDLLTLLRLTS